jgi:phosphate starvation-inducible PhoH-like protein
VVTGDVTQVDLNGRHSGLATIEKILGNIDGIRFIHLTSKDVVRHRIVADIVAAYEQSS